MSRRSTSAAPPPEPRQRFMSPAAVSAFALIAGLGLVVVMPAQEFSREVAAADPHDPLAMDYVRNLLRTDPGNVELRELLARGQFEAGNLYSAAHTLSLLLHDPDPGTRRRARALDYRIARAHLDRAPAGAQGPERARARAALRAVLADGVPAAQTERFAGDALALGEPKAALGLYRRLLAEQSRPPAWSARVARLALGQGEYRQAADFYFAAQEESLAPSLRRYYFLAGLRTLQSGNLLGEAMREAEARAGALADDRDTLIQLAKLARAANRLDLAEKYAKRLLKMAAWRKYQAMLAAAGIGLERAAVVRVAAPQADDPAPQAENPAPQADNAVPQADNAVPADSLAPPADGDADAMLKSFDEAVYSLSYDIFLANRNLQDAYRVALSAVQHRPESEPWRRRLAQVAEWIGRPAVALEQWKWLARHTDEQAAWDAMGRLSAGLYDSDTRLLVLAREAERGELTEARVRELTAAFEAAGRPDDAVRFLWERYRAAPRAHVLAAIARLYERVGRDGEALETYTELMDRYGATRDTALKAARLHIAQGDFGAALDTLDRARGDAPDADAEFWDLYGDLAWQSQEHDRALAAYRRLTGGQKPEALAYERHLFLIREEHPREAAELAIAAWRTRGQTSFLLAALELYTGLGDWQAGRTLLTSLDAEQQKTLEADPGFLLARAQIRQNGDDVEGALSDYLAAHRLRPSVDTRAAALWLLVDRDRKDLLRRYVRDWEAGARAGPQGAPLWPALAAAYAALGQPGRALPYYRKDAPRHGDDYLWLLNYADTLEAAGDPATAWRVRQRVWVTLRRQPPRTLDDPLMLAYARLALERGGGDAAAPLMRRLLAAGGRPADCGPAAPCAALPDPASTPAPAQAAALQELALSWALSTEQYDVARAWLWRNYARRLAQPYWAEIALALNENDLGQVRELLAAHAAELPIYDRIEAAIAGGYADLARQTAFEALEANPDDDTLHLQLTRLLPDTSDRASAEVVSGNAGSVDITETRLIVSLEVNPKLRLEPELRLTRQESRDDTLLAAVPAQDRRIGLRAPYRHSHGLTLLELYRRSALNDFTVWQASHEVEWTRGLVAAVSLGRNLRAEEGSALRIGGMKDHVQLGLRYQFSGREYLNINLAQDEFFSQDRTYLGQGDVLSWEVGHRMRVEYPDVNVRLNGSVQSYTADGSFDGSIRQLLPGEPGGLDLIIPEDFKQYGLNVGLGEGVRENYTRAVRPFADVGYSHNSLQGGGYNLNMGLAATLDGEDQMAVHFTRVEGGGGLFENDQLIGLRYSRFF